ncbi:MAG: hypothetical protein EOP45_21905 [Sphingobacteriaceae bacterium]|nr:MAG: hypothetical protein EOP45_21905 [Sphingobacteriaceae bacterium]
MSDTSVQGYISLIENSLNNPNKPSYRIAGQRLYPYRTTDNNDDINYRDSGLAEVGNRLSGNFVYHAIQTLEALFG